MANSVQIGSTEIPTPLAPEVVGGPTPGLTEAEVADGPIHEHDKLEGITSKEEAVEASKGRKGGKETNNRRDSLDHVNTALVISVGAVALVGAIVTIAKMLRER